MTDELEAERWLGHRREHELLIAAGHVARENIDRRLSEMNALREQINHERGEYLSRANFEPRHELLITRISELEQSRSNSEGRVWALGAMGGALIVVLEIGLRFLHV